MFLIKVIIIGVLGVIAYQDFKDRKVYGFVFFVLIGLLGVLHFQNVNHINFLYAVLINLGVLIVIIGTLYVYNLIRIQRPFFEEVFGLGDLLFFLVLGVSFPTITFIILLVFSLLFSVVTWFVVKKRAKHNTIPLAGYMSVFLGVICITYWNTNMLTLYLI
ncbi:hypothetical protein ACFSTE_13510 [Aquimarina hainanensis]|uniref:Prepilin type IV endopeptidase peptidase domain-containing protein n=1 Tax=Aquimarina hainanensis TaxID=1578017 RepID=A0ABW5NCD7_9FLAO|nr:hypothetical protein [Aquimarina sp. TRL1]QKX04096.1 hypothetical protein HN014_03955 [Aquimarina sp. TRL1]